MTNDLYIKQLLYQSHHRGTRETDFLIGGFADAHLTTFMMQQLQAYEDFLKIPDSDILDWVYKKSALTPPTEMIRLFLKYVEEDA